ncbi:hypothetical protein AC579_1906 [Pseudocercospora musae]|uniref:Uncharacterized protein n=1 Tax=Pseudocercospora musae TaxID=113226 RepID=A0A139I045_9PEZI|nr:hypothetical protein AC579_1906 [Pseudocercospora musae]
MQLSRVLIASSLYALATSIPITLSGNDLVQKRQYKSSGFSKYVPQDADDWQVEKRQYKGTGFSKYIPQDADDGQVKKRQYSNSDYSVYQRQNANDGQVKKG